MRAPSDVPRRQPRMTRRRIWVLVAVIVLVVLIASLRGIAIFYTDYLWFNSVNLNNVWKGVLGAKIGLALVFIAIFFVALWVNLAIADKLAPKFRPLGPEDELVQRYQDAIAPHARLVRTVVALVFALLVGTGASAQWKNWILFHNAVPFGIKDPQFHRDVSFFVFRLPMINFLISWAFLALAVTAIVVAIAHYLNGGIRFQGPGQRVSPQVKAHLSVLLGLMAIDKAIGYYFQRFELDTSTRGVVQGATYTDVHAQLPAINLLIFVSIAAFVLFMVNIRRQGWVLPAIGVGLWLFLALVVGVIYPAFIQTFKVQPSQSVLESPYIQRNIQATRQAMGLNHVQNYSFPVNNNLSVSQLTQDGATLNSVKLWETDNSITLPTYEKLQDIRSYYQLNELSVDRYPINGQMTPAIVGVRQLNASQLPAQSWLNQHLQYTHGYGAILSPANQYTVPDGNPTFVVKDVPPTSSSSVPSLTQPSVYFGVNLPGYVVADTKQPELDYQLPNGANQETTYKGNGGVDAGSLIRRAAFALRFGDKNMLISSLITGHSKVIFVRDIRDMVQKAAPFLQFDSDPYPIILNGRVFWMQDAYTTTDRYPYGQTPDTGALNNNSGLSTSFNYVRNSVKILIDAYSGTMTFYQMDPHDPIINTYAKAFPGMFTPASQIKPALRQHLRYPEDIFTIQATMYGQYHITNPRAFYGAGDRWNLSQNPGTGSPSAALTSTSPTNAQGQQSGPSQTTRMRPIYQVMRLPTDSNISFNLLDAFVPFSNNDVQQNLSAFMIASNDPDHYGRLQVFVTPRGVPVDGPALVDSRISASPDISRQISLLNQQGSQVELGNVLMIPVQKSLLYIRPLYVSSSRNPLPEYKYVIVVYGTQASMQPTLQQALGQVFGQAVPNFGGNQPVTTPTLPTTTGPSSGANGQVQNLLNQAQQAYNQSQTDLKAGNLGAFQTDVNNMESLIKQAQQAASSPSASGSGSSTTGTTTPANSA